MPPATSQSDTQSNGYPTDAAYPSRNIAFQAAGMITSIVENLIAHDELRYAPAFMSAATPILNITGADFYNSVYSLFSALIMHVYQMRSPLPSIVAATQARIQVCMYAMKEVSKVWLVAKMVHTLFESILGNKMLEERLQKAAGKRHKRPRLDSSQPTSRDDPVQQKRKYDDLELGFSGTPAPQVSYERSRPQTPAVTPSRELGAPHLTAPAVTSTPSAHLRQPNDTFMGSGSSRNNTRPPTPFNPSYSVPASPPELYLVTRNSPPISQSLWENFQPDQLFPDGTNMSIPHYSSTSQQNLDPQLQLSMQSSPNLQQHSHMPGQPLPTRGMRGSQDANPESHLQGMQAGASGLQIPHVMPNQTWSNHFGGDGQSPEDTWSNGSSIGQAVPATLNVEDWSVSATLLSSALRLLIRD